MKPGYPQKIHSVFITLRIVFTWKFIKVWKSVGKKFLLIGKHFSPLHMQHNQQNSILTSKSQLPATFFSLFSFSAKLRRRQECKISHLFGFEALPSDALKDETIVCCYAMFRMIPADTQNTIDICRVILEHKFNWVNGKTEIRTIMSKVVCVCMCVLCIFNGCWNEEHSKQMKLRKAIMNCTIHN